MSNPKGNPESLEPHKLKTDREEPLTKQIAVRVTETVYEKIKSVDNVPEFLREAIDEKLEKLDKQAK